MGSFIIPLNSGWLFTWRSAAVCWRESCTDKGPWLVNGHHWETLKGGRLVEVGKTVATNCNIYDGWWESKGPG